MAAFTSSSVSVTRFPPLYGGDWVGTQPDGLTLTRSSTKTLFPNKIPFTGSGVRTSASFVETQLTYNTIPEDPRTISHLPPPSASHSCSQPAATTLTHTEVLPEQTHLLHSYMFLSATPSPRQPPRWQKKARCAANEPPWALAHPRPPWFHLFCV